MQTDKDLPGVIVNQLDGGLHTSFRLSDDAVLVLGTAGARVVNTSYQVQNMSSTSAQFGFNGLLFHCRAEASTYSDNVIGHCIGATPMQLQSIGADQTPGALTPDFNIIFSDVTADAATRYKLWYSVGVFAVWKDNEIQFSSLDFPWSTYNVPRARRPQTSPPPEITSPAADSSSIWHPGSARFSSSAGRPFSGP